MAPRHPKGTDLLDLDLRPGERSFGEVSEGGEGESDSRGRAVGEEEGRSR